MSAWEPTEIAPRLWRWTAEHPAWAPDAAAESAADWDQMVGSTACELGDALVFIDPLVPSEREGFWRWAEARGRSRRVHVLTTLAFHRRDREQLVERLGASSSRAAAALPEGITPKPLRGAGEVAFWIEPLKALVFGDRILGASGGLRLCPSSWLRYLGISTSQLADIVRPLLELPIERVLVSHGEPVLTDGREALRRALE